MSAKDIQYLDFSYNWNGKLGCSTYTTLRVSNPAKYHPGAKFQVRLNKKPLHTAQVLAVRQITPFDINDWIAYLDTGYDAQETRNILQRMYKTLNMKLDWILLRALK